MANFEYSASNSNYCQAVAFFLFTLFIPALVSKCNFNGPGEEETVENIRGQEKGRNKKLFFFGIWKRNALQKKVSRITITSSKCDCKKKTCAICSFAQKRCEVFGPVDFLILLCHHSAANNVASYGLPTAQVFTVCVACRWFFAWCASVPSAHKRYQKKKQPNCCNENRRIRSTEHIHYPRTSAIILARLFFCTKKQSNCEFISTRCTQARTNEIRRKKNQRK